MAKSHGNIYQACLRRLARVITRGRTAWRGRATRNRVQSLALERGRIRGPAGKGKIVTPICGKIPTSADNS